MPHKWTGASQKVKAFQAVMKSKMLACIYLLMSLQSKKAIEHQNETLHLQLAYHTHTHTALIKGCSTGFSLLSLSALFHVESRLRCSDKSSVEKCPSSLPRTTQTWPVDKTQIHNCGKENKNEDRKPTTLSFCDMENRSMFFGNWLLTWNV